VRNFLKTYKEELITIPLLMIGIWLIRLAFGWFFPDSGLYDLPSEFETIYWTVIKMVVYTSLAWFSIRIVFPPVFKFLKEEFYEGFEHLKADEKRRIGLIVFFAFLFSLVFLSKGYAQTNEMQLRSTLIHQLHDQLDVREATGNNDGVMVEKYLETCGLPKGYAWCAAFCTYNLNEIGVTNPQSAWSPHWARKKDRIPLKEAKPGDCVSFYYPRLGRVGHVGFYAGRSPDGYLVTIEGNTNRGGSRNGDGVYKRKRPPGKIYAITRYIKQ
jgi:hypothetical protein